MGCVGVWRVMIGVLTVTRAAVTRLLGGWRVVCGQADARWVSGGGRGWWRRVGDRVSRWGLGALAGARTRRRAGLPRASLLRGAGSSGGRGGRSALTGAAGGSAAA